MKRCNKCGLKKALDQFNKKSSRKDGRQAKCRECSNKYCRSHYRDNTDAEKARIKSRRQEIKDRFEEFKSGQCCVVCGESEICCLDFHHLDPDQKDVDIAIAVNWGYGWERIQEEVSKCVVLCANCHRKVHAGKLELVTQE